jgi:hypothetical protein
MLKRMLQLVGGLLAVGALIVAPTGAGASPTARMSGGGGSGCQDQYPPHSNWGNGWRGQDRHGGYWRGWGDGNGYAGGQSWDSSCTAFDEAGKVARVMLAVQRERGSQCQNLGRRGLGRRTDCSHNHWFRAEGTQHWHHNITSALPRGRYRLRHRAIDSAGNRGRVHSMHLRIR